MMTLDELIHQLQTVRAEIGRGDSPTRALLAERDAEVGE